MVRAYLLLVLILSSIGVINTIPRVKMPPYSPMPKPVAPTITGKTGLGPLPPKTVQRSTLTSHSSVDTRSDPINAISSMPSPQIDSNLVGPSTLPANVPHNETKLYKLSTERSSFYAQGLYWVFWENTGTCEGQNGCLFYATSPNGQSWNTPVNVGVHVNREDYSIVSNSTHVFYARYNETRFFSTVCNHALLFRTGALANPIVWNSEQVVKPGNQTASWLDPVLRLGTDNQAWIGLMDFSNTGCGGNGNQRPAVIHSSGSDYTSWQGYTYLTIAQSHNWIVDLTPLPNGAMYAIYSIFDTPRADLRGRLFNSTWGVEERISPSSDIVDTDAFVFSSGTSVFAVWLDTTTQTLSYNGRLFAAPSSGTWNTTVRIANAECCSVKTFYPVPWTATFDPGSSKIHIYWYNFTLNQIDLYSGLSTTWTGPTPGWTTVKSDSLASLTAFQYSANTGSNATIGIAFIDASTTATPNLKYGVEQIPTLSIQSLPTGGGGRLGHFCEY